MPGIDFISAGLIAVNAELDKLPVGKRGAFVTVIDGNRFATGFATRLFDGSWVLSAQIEKVWKRAGINGQIIIGKVW